MKKRNIMVRINAALALTAALSAAAGENPVVRISEGPLFSGRSNVHPNMLLSLSVEFPTVGIAYRSDNGTYNRNYEYVGYFNPKKCYVYHGGNRNLTDEGYFHILKDADSVTHECSDSFSGNFMNWAASSAIDMLRYALTGGDRIIDTPTTTILQRAVLRDSAKGNFYAHSTYFPRRKVTAGGNVSAPNRVTPFNTGTLYIVSCRNRILFSDSSSGLLGNRDADSKEASKYCTSTYDEKGTPAKEAIDKKLGEYLVRVKVCDGSEGPKRTDLCQKYGNNYKPVGEIQRNSGKLRLAAMGYLLDDAATRYGGVLRAPMKYVGPSRLEAPDFLEIANDRLEWDPETGVFYNNPENPGDRNNTAVHSGVINYLNKFGRSGVYKTFDPVGELYYEGLRYLQGKQPTPEATTGITDAMKDGFPVHEIWTDPLIASCSDNYIVSIADVNTHWDRYIPGNNRTTYGSGSNAHDNVRAADTEVVGKTPALDVKDWTQKVGEMEGSSAYTNPASNANLNNLQAKDTGAAGHGTYYMAGLAYWANTNGIRLDKLNEGKPARVKTYTIDVDEGGNGQIDGNTRNLKPRESQLYLAAKYGGFDDMNGDGNPFITLGADKDKKTVVTGSNAEWDNGKGVPANYFLAGQPQQMIQSIRKVFASLGEDSGTISGVTASTTRISSDDAYVYQPGFNSSKWSGSLKKIALGSDGGTIKIATTIEWDAGEVLTGKETGTEKRKANPLPDDRHIYTAKITDGGSLSTIEFKWNNLTDAQKALLNTSPVDQENDELGAQRLDFLRGQRNLESNQRNGIFRTRDSVLGDIINSNPVYVGAPALNVQGDGYLAFYEKHEKRSPAVYVGANDGMLHAFSAADGKELFAYVPGALFPYLNRLTSPEYVHRPYVDGALTVAEAKVGGQWKTVLASGMGGGAQGVFALDVTNPSDFSGGTGAIFEFTDADDPDMGNLMGAPIIAKFKTGIKDGVPEYKYFVVVPSGLNNYKDDGKNRFNTDAAGALFLLSLDKVPSAKWALGRNYFKFRTPSKDDTLRNGLSSPALVIGAGGAVRYGYAGDLQGNMWRFDFTGEFPWKNAIAGATPLFTAKDDVNGSRQPITIQPKVVFAPNRGYLVLFGTGKFVEGADAAVGSFSMQSFYAIHDTTESTYTVSGRSELMLRTLEKSGDGEFKIAGDAFSYGSGDKGRKGWYFDFPASDKSGERAVTNPLVVNGMLFFNSLIPGGDPCLAGGGRSYTLNALTGLPANGNLTGALSQVGMLSTPVLFNMDASVSDRNAIGRRTVRKTHTVVNFGTGGEKGGALPAESSETVLPVGRFSWREILNWQELRNAITKK